MSRIERYEIVTSDSPVSLSLKVNEMLSDGWQPWGSLLGYEARFSDGMDQWRDNLFAQAMIRWDTE